METRKSDHIHLARSSQSSDATVNIKHKGHLGTSPELHYEPMLSGNVSQEGGPRQEEVRFGPWSFSCPLWISSMTGGAKEAFVVNGRLARAAKHFQLGMGLGSCRPLWDQWKRESFHIKSLDSLEMAKDFRWRQVIGDRPLFANFGVAQIEQIGKSNQTTNLVEFMKFLEVDGLCIHVNPLQEFLQPEGDQWQSNPLEIITGLLEALKGKDIKIIVKEVGQGMGPKSLAALSKLPLFAVEFAALGGTNFSWIEWKRNKESNKNNESKESQEFSPLAEILKWGHTAEEMFLNVLKLKHEGHWSHPVIISGGVREWTPYFSKERHLRGLGIEALIGSGWPMMAKALEGEESLFQWLSDVKSLNDFHRLMYS